jgi:hypothetical protein
MGYSEAVFDTVADLLVSQEQPKQSCKVHGMDDYVIALSIDSGLAMEDVRIRLNERMAVARDRGRSVRSTQ